MSYPPPGENPNPGQDPNQPQQPYGQASTPPYSDPYGQQPGSPADPYGQQPGYPPPGYPPPGYAQPRSTNIMAILSLVLAFVFSPAGIVLGHIASKQIRQTGEEGAGLAKAGMIISYVFTGLYLLFCCGWLGFVIWASSQASTTGY